MFRALQTLVAECREPCVERLGSTMTRRSLMRVSSRIMKPVGHHAALETLDRPLNREIHHAWIFGTTGHRKCPSPANSHGCF